MQVDDIAVNDDRSTMPDAFDRAAWAAVAAGDTARGQALLNDGLARWPGHPELLTSVAALWRRQGRLSDALRLLDKILTAVPQAPRAWLERAFVFDDGGSLRNAGDSYRRAAALDPCCAPALAGAAFVATRTGDGTAALDLARRALALDPHNVTATRAAAWAEIEAGAPAAAAARLRAVDVDAFAPEQRVAVLTLLGDALDALDDPRAAFAAYLAANKAFAAAHSPHFRSGPSQQELIDRLAKGPLPVRGFADTSPGRAARHIFLTGYPRSGNTLVENILASGDRVIALEERPTLADADAAFLGSDDGTVRLAALDAAGARPLQAAYWTKARATAGVPLDGQILVDMDPLKSIKLPVIAALFPETKIILLRRDPRDVVWSCFRHAFRLSAAAYAFSDLESAARHYASLMHLTERCLAELPLTAMVVRYEDIVDDFDAATRSICAFAGIDWTPKMRAFARTADVRGVTTASAPQVRRGLFDGRGQWRRHESDIAAVLPILQPWVDRFGYV